jgi:hypothetical protein
MGYFSWRCAKTKKSIANIDSTRRTKPVYILQPGEQDNLLTDGMYEGYGAFTGDFGRIDMHVWLAEQNAEALNIDLGRMDEDEKRDIGISLDMGSIHVDTQTGKRWSIFRKAPDCVGATHFPGNFVEIMPDYGVSPNDAVKQGLLKEVPIKEVVELPFPIKLCIRDMDYDSVGESEDCPEQGFFY